MDNNFQKELQSVTDITNDRFAELIRKEEQLNIITRMLSSGKCIFAEDIKLIVGLEEKERSDV